MSRSIKNLTIFFLMLACLLSGSTLFAQNAANKNKKKKKPQQQRPQRQGRPTAINWVNKKSGKPMKSMPKNVTHQTFASKAAGKATGQDKQDVGYCIYLPPSYKKNKKQRYPVIYNLHGNGGNEFTVIDAATLLHKGILAGKWPEIIMVFPNGGHTTFYMDHASGKFPIETVFIKEMIPHIDKTYRTIAKPEARCIEGFSMGGRGATRLAMKYPDLFCSLFCQAGNVPKILENYKPDDRTGFPNAFLGQDKQNYADSDVYLLVEKNKDQILSGLRINIACGTADMGHLKTLRTYKKRLDELQIPHDYLEIPDLDHNRKKMMAMYKDTWYDFHVKSLKRGVKSQLSYLSK